MFAILYEMGLIFLFLLVLPKYLYRIVVQGKYRSNVLNRFGMGFPEIQKGADRLIWIHAVSMGETRCMIPLIKKIRAEQPKCRIILSSLTETGHMEGKQQIPEANHHVYLPFDFFWIIHPLIESVRPDVVILSETDYWYNFLRCAKRAGSQIFVVNGKISERSKKLYQMLPWYAGRVFGLIDHLCVQNREYLQRFSELGVPPERLTITGNMKFDAAYPALPPESLAEWKMSLGIPEKNLVVVAGSTHDPEEILLLDVMERLWREVSDVTLVLVPRHPERFEEVAKMLKDRQIPFHRYTALHKSDPRVKVCLVDAMGILKQCYQIGDIAVVAGSFTPRVGGHNVIEPSGYGVPVLFGPFTHNQKELVEWMLSYQAGLQTSCEDLYDTLMTLYLKPSQRQFLGQNGLKLAEELRGVVEKTYKIIFSDKKACGK